MYKIRRLESFIKINYKRDHINWYQLSELKKKAIPIKSQIFFIN